MDWGSQTSPEVRMGYDGDRGLMLHAGVKKTRFGFLSDPYSSRTQTMFGWAWRPVVRRWLVQRSLGALRDMR